MTTLNRRGLVKLFNHPFLSRRDLATKLGISRQWLYSVVFEQKESSALLTDSLNARIKKLLTEYQ